jgi:two-component system, OmpR family, response regulator ChvI
MPTTTEPSPAIELLPGSQPQARVMVVDDDTLFLQVLAENLQGAGYDVLAFDDPQRALDCVRQGVRPGVYVLDWNLSGLDGLTLLRRLRELDGQAPVVFLTSYGQPIFEEAALDAGAVDFVDKARGPAIIRHRLTLALTRRSAPGGASNATDDHELRVGKLYLSRASKRASWGSSLVPLSRNEFDVVALLAEKAGQDVGYRQIYDAIRGYGFAAGAGDDGYRANVRAMVKRIRRKFLDLDAEFAALHNYPGFGYRWQRDGG